MSHFAEIDENNVVLRVLVGDNNDPAGDEGKSWFEINLGGTWVKTSYNAATNGFRKNYAGIGYTYDEARDAFIPPMPPTTIPDPENEGKIKEVAWTLNEDTCNWDIVE